MPAEKQFETKIKKFLDEQGCYWVKHFANAYTKVGIPDILACVNGFFVAIEVKAPNGKPSPLQIHNIRKINELGGLGVILYPNQFEDFKEIIYRLKETEFGAWEIANRINERWCGDASQPQSN